MDSSTFVNSLLVDTGVCDPSRNRTGPDTTFLKVGVHPVSLDPATIGLLTGLVTAFGVAAERIITALRRYHGPPSDPPRRKRLRKTGEGGDG